ncbi:Hypothetical protein [Corynebacterium glutamicum ATCC 13032]|uniref:Uncharacterized protein n=1 Tax=Corynebacterium glutamicum (strain ATCC 13032 / DSM 20300 / JCM 1318 / BCRC 11384 / CCUG 27702 / LMG 3730 / NBRC 12168 / NCIMB 10025 / NRRL B-2784 / 534) TaxID=196627 RepID=Q8NTM6_CORGL|nr:Hypothetical protein [Corynebacterium glutamicum ATCC 13032]
MVGFFDSGRTPGAPQAHPSAPQAHPSAPQAHQPSTRANASVRHASKGASKKHAPEALEMRSPVG